MMTMVLSHSICAKDTKTWRAVHLLDYNTDDDLDLLAKNLETLAKQGIRSENLEGGILAWSFVGGDLWTKDKDGSPMPTNRIHTYSQEWNLVHPDYVGVW